MANPAFPPALESRRAQMFPALTPGEIGRMRRFGTVGRYAGGERLFEAGKDRMGMFVVLSGSVRVTSHDSLGHEAEITEQGVGQFLAELGQLSGRPTFVDGYAVGEVEALIIGPEQLRALLVAEAELGERIMRALILRRIFLIETGSGGPVVIGSSTDGDVVRLRNFLGRNGHPYRFFDPADDAEAKLFIERYARSPEDHPIVACPDGSVLHNPTESALAHALGMIDRRQADLLYDVIVVGAGPAGLATAVYAASEGLQVAVVDARSFGGQAGASARIENYLGFPTGISGMALAGRAFTQAQKFGAQMLIPSEALRLDCSKVDKLGELTVELSDARVLRSRAVVIATGARYRRPDCSKVSTMEGRGVWYWASPIEAKMCATQEVALVGAGNSAGQGAVFLSGHVSKVWMLVRGDGLEKSMSRYLINRIAATPNIELRVRTELTHLTGTRQGGVESVRWRHLETGNEESRPIRNVFMFLGADPATEWLKDCGVVLDEKGFIVTGAAQGSAVVSREALETSVPGVFAIGDVRASSVKRVGGAIGEGAAVVAQIHAFLAKRAA